jgi:DNA-binding NtrC family response regulator
MSKISVILIDDEEELVTALQERLLLRGIDAEYALNGEMALKRIEEKAFNVAVIDVLMPHISGLEVLMKIKQLRPTIQAILLTGCGNQDESRLGQVYGAFEYIIKPVDINKLVELIKKAAGVVDERL